MSSLHIVLDVCKFIDFNLNAKEKGLKKRGWRVVCGIVAALGAVRLGFVPRLLFPPRGQLFGRCAQCPQLGEG